ncbi:MarR family winged helix-turn-helix transcriptional regulator [Chryseobacterium culicis]|uniref:MarR family transcriptional regulator n=1 Tax=Chryseobacterium culicis TaxID=680127 RepID=A0A2S9CXF3_CHRCI|nr:MarR family winged helix-turn-helix transcriptional regulator [Chryseobacterium culicis]PRB85208.1 MarR family transcriptional regulator [Chryseobacterium culicis]PRB91419.1 MarR family transcriptional regulator [Chryseobacterium culicis]
MNFDLIKSVIELVQQFMKQNEGKSLYNNDLKGFTKWINISYKDGFESQDPDWIGKEFGRSSDSVITTLLIRMNRYAKSYSRSVISNSAFSSQDDFIYLINLKVLGTMSKMELIRCNLHEKSSGILIINRLLRNGWAAQTVVQKDKRKKVIQITEKGLAVLANSMDEIRMASKVVAGNLTHPEQMLLIAILSKLDEFHHSFYRMNLESRDLLDLAYKKLN